MSLGINMSGCQTYHLCEGEGFLVGGGGVGVGHGQDEGDAPGQSGCGGRRPILLVSGSWLPNMHVHVDKTYDTTVRRISVTVKQMSDTVRRISVIVKHMSDTVRQMANVSHN
jgi:hypothetical protein